jgi:small subunit ribosomal protein S17
MADENENVNETDETGTPAEETVADAPAVDEPETAAEEATAKADEPVADAPAAEPAEPVAEAEPEAETASADEAEPAAEAEAPAAEAAPAAQSGPKPKRKRLPRSERPKRTRPKRVPSTERKPIVRLETPEHERGRRQERQGIVVSDAMEKTIVVRVDVVKAHPRYKKVVRRSVKFHAHDETSQAKVGDVVRIVETRPLSKTKRWRLAEVVEAAK